MHDSLDCIIIVTHWIASCPITIIMSYDDCIIILDSLDCIMSCHDCIIIHGGVMAYGDQSIGSIGGANNFCKLAKVNNADWQDWYICIRISQATHFNTHLKVKFIFCMKFEMIGCLYTQSQKKCNIFEVAFLLEKSVYQ